MESAQLVINADKSILDELEKLISSVDHDGTTGMLPIVRAERRKPQPIAGSLNLPSGEEIVLFIAGALLQDFAKDGLKYVIVAKIKPILLQLKEKFPKAKILVSSGHEKETIDLGKIED